MNDKISNTINPIGDNVASIEQISSLINSTNNKIQSLNPNELLSFSENTVDDIVKLSEQNRKNQKNNSIVTDWEKQQKLDRWMRGIYAIVFLLVVIGQLIIINDIVYKIGNGICHFEQWVINTFFVSVFGEITGIVYLIVRYLFLPLGKEILSLMKDI